jgi:pyruvate dehydrogenase complex dehydrogenase (E1) component
VADFVDSDPPETAEWRDAFAALLAAAGPPRVREIMVILDQFAREPRVSWQPAPRTPYVNTIPATNEPAFPGDLAIEALQVAVDNPDQVVELLACSQRQCAHALRLIHLAVAEHAPYRSP